MDKILVYTSITGDKDKPRNDIPVLNWCYRFVKPVMNAKIFKILSHKFIDADISIWVDGNIKLRVDPQRLVDEFLRDADMATWKHFDRDCIYDEAPAAKGIVNDPQEKELIGQQIAHYEEIGFPKHMGLAECNVIIRRKTERVNQFNEAWWAEICRWSCRDQLSFPVIISKFPDIKVNYIEGNVRQHKYFEYETH